MRAHKIQLGLIVLIVLIGFIGIALPYPIFAPMFLHPQNNTIIPYNWPLSMRGIILGFVLSVYPFGQFIASPILGVFSDYFGRKKLLLICLIGTTIVYLVTALSIYLKSIILLIISRFITGLLEGNIAIALCQYLVQCGLVRDLFLRQIFLITDKSNLSGPDRGSARGLTKFI